MMFSQTDLQRTLHRIDGKGYPVYKDIRGSYKFDDFTLFIDHVQGDPYPNKGHARAKETYSKSLLR